MFALKQVKQDSLWLQGFRVIKSYFISVLEKLYLYWQQTQEPKLCSLFTIAKEKNRKM